jgi:phage gp36-like protein
MMAVTYATPQDFTLLGLPMEALDGVSFDVESHLDAATAVVNSYLRGRYKVPLAAPYPLEITLATAVIAAWNFINVRGFDPENRTDISIRLRYEDTLVGRSGQKSWLQALADGKVNLDVAADQTAMKHEGGPLVRSRRSRDRCGRDCG